MNTSTPHPFIKWFAAITITDIPFVGGKNASLGERVRELRQHHFHSSLIIEMSARENESVNDTLARGRRGRNFRTHLLPTKNANARPTSESDLQHEPH